MPAVAIPAAVSLGTSIFGGIMGSRASNKAAQTQYNASQQAIQRFMDSLKETNPLIQSAADQAKADVTGAAGTARDRLLGTAETGATGITTAADRANEFLAPYLQGGGQAFQSLMTMMQPGGDLNRNFTAADMQTLDPGYQFRIDQANKALAGSAAARGGALGGGQLKALSTLSQNLASSEMQNAFDRFRAQQSDRFGRFNTLANMGLTAGTTSGANLMDAANRAALMRTGAAQTAGGWDIGAAEYGGSAERDAAQQIASNTMGTTRSIADLMTGGANAQAAGTMGSANAWGQALGGVSNAAQGVGRYYQNQDLLKRYPMYRNPALKPSAYNWDYGG